MSKTNFLKKLGGELSYSAAAGIGALGGAGMAWWQGNSILSGAFYGALGGLGVHHFSGDAFSKLAKEFSHARKSPDAPEWLRDKSMRGLEASLRHPTLGTRQGVALIGGGLAGGMFSTHNGHRRKAAGFNSRRGNYIGA